jgi:putative membrane protein
MWLILRWLLNALALWVTAELVPGIGYDSVTALLLAALVIGLINAIIRPILLVLTIPITVLTLGLFLLVLNALCFWLVTIVPGFHVEGFLAALIGSIVMAVVGFALSFLVK